MGKTRITLFEIEQLAKRIRQINSLDISQVDFIDASRKRVKIDKKIIADFKFTGLNLMDFITTGFYKTGFSEAEKIKISPTEPTNEAQSEACINTDVMESVLPLLRECIMRCNLALPETSQDLQWFEETCDIKNSGDFWERIHTALELGGKTAP